MNKITFREVIAKLGNENKFTVELPDGGTIEAYCWTDDPEVLEWPATFSVAPSWGEMGAANRKGELDVYLWTLCEKIEAALPGTKWGYAPADESIVQND